MRLIALHGKASAGKDTFADRLVAKHGFVKRGFADPLYEEVAAAFDVTVEWLRDRTRKEMPQSELMLFGSRNHEFRKRMVETGISDLVPLSPRWVLQKWGTEYRRGQDDQYWLARMAVFYQQHRLTHGVVIPDCRFENEAQWVKGHDGTIIEIRRSGLPEGTHASDARLPDGLVDEIIWNDWQIAALHGLADQRAGVEEATT